MRRPTPGHGIALRLEPEGTVREVFVDGLGIFESDPVGRPLPELVHPSSREKAETFVAQAAVEPSVYDWELTVETRGRMVLLSFSGGRQADGSVVVVAGASTTDIEQMYEDLLRINNEQANLLRQTVRDLAALERESRARPSSAYDEMMQLNNELAGLQRELARKNAQLERLNEQKNQVLGMVAHDLRNPLGVVAGYASVMLKGRTGELSPKQRKFLDAIARSSRHMLSMVEELVDFSAIEAGKLELDREAVDMSALLDEAVDMSRVLAEQKDIAIEYASPGELVVDADPRKLQQVVTNLLSNAVKYSHESTTIRVRVEATEDVVSVAVSDEGQGIPPDEVDGLFRPFGRTSVKSTAGEKSTGLGLAIVKKIVEAHGGSIEVESQVGEGSTFTFSVRRRG